VVRDDRGLDTLSAADVLALGVATSFGRFSAMFRYWRNSFLSLRRNILLLRNPAPLDSRLPLEAVTDTMATGYRKGGGDNGTH
jgi:hypothetical protein